MCQMKGEVNESATQAGCAFKDVSIFGVTSLFEGNLLYFALLVSFL